MVKLWLCFTSRPARFMFPAMAAMLVAGSGMAAHITPGDARRGEQLFQSQQCVQCHSFNSKGGTLAPDLAKRTARAYTPALMASLMWNHAPARSAMQKQGISRAALSPESAGRSVRVLRLGALLRTAGRSSPREAGLRQASLCRMPRDRNAGSRGRAGGSKVGVAGGPAAPGRADVKLRRKDARGICREEARLGYG